MSEGHPEFTSLRTSRIRGELGVTATPTTSDTPAPAQFPARHDREHDLRPREPIADALPATDPEGQEGVARQVLRPVRQPAIGIEPVRAEKYVRAGQ